MRAHVLSKQQAHVISSLFRLRNLVRRHRWAHLIYVYNHHCQRPKDVKDELEASLRVKRHDDDGDLHGKRQEQCGLTTRVLVAAI